ncbi:hypothetical protein [Bacillus mycoides]|uniref:hypothetical protein n=1 Tax=Bacillus mycoides TaxID=1405 RepID=UPI002E1C127D|nr:hypothetical protein [Bacillus mycoides]
MDGQYIDLKNLDYKIPPSALDFLENERITKFKVVGGKVFINKNDFQRHEWWERRFQQEYFTIRQFCEYIGIVRSDKSLVSACFRRLVKIADDIGIYVRKLRYPLVTLYEKSEYRHEKRFIRKKEVVDIVNNYMRDTEFQELTGLKKGTIWEIIKNHNIRKIDFAGRGQATFYHREDIEKYLAYRKKTIGQKMRINVQNDDLIMRTDVFQILNLNNHTYEKFLENKFLNIKKKIGRHVYFNEDDILHLRKQIDDLDNKLRSKYYTRSEILAQYDLNIDTAMLEIEKIEVPLLLRVIPKYHINKYLYLKSDVAAEVERRENRFNLFVDRGSIYDNVIYRVEVEGIAFSECCKETERLWFKYLYEKSKNSKTQNNGSYSGRISEYFNATKVLTEWLIDKEIFMYSSKELNFMFFSNENRVKKIIYLFLKEIHEMTEYAHRRKKFKLRELKSPFKVWSNEHKGRSNRVYSPSEYTEFFKYITDLTMHKDKAIDSVKEDINKYIHSNSKRIVYNRYESIWLYMLVHLNNAWRHWDCTEIPRIDFNGTSIEDSIDWLRNNDICVEDAEKIITKLKVKCLKLKHSKTGAQRYFYCSNQLVLPVAYALVLCEIRTRILNPLSESLIDFGTKNRKITKAVYEGFFEDFSNSSLKFTSLKMNRTFITLAYSIIKDYGGPAHELEILKFLRNHKSIESTNLYIYVDQKDLNFLSKQVFSRDSFGFIADGFANILFGTSRDIAERTKQIEIIYNKLGKDLRLEGIINSLAYLVKRENAVIDIIKGLDRDEIRYLHNQLNMGLLYSKTNCVQCIISPAECIYQERDDCIGCPFAIYNFYALSTITEKILQHVKKLMESYGKYEYKGDLERDAILFIKDLKLFKEAEEKFGDSIYDFFNITREEFEGMLRAIPSIAKYIPEIKR